MMQKNTLFLILAFVASQVFSGCSTAKFYNFGSKSADESKTIVQANPKGGITTNETASAQISAPITEPQLEASVGQLAPAPVHTSVNLSKKAIAPQVKNEAVKPPSKTERKQAVKELKEEVKALKKVQKDNASPAVVSTVLLVILAVLLPPLAVYLVRGIGEEFWISILLTLLFWLPGVIYALFIIFS